ncbi:unnamed protein product [Mucor circinelloides]
MLTNKGAHFWLKTDTFIKKKIFEGKNPQNLVRRSWSRPILLCISMKADATPSSNESDCRNSWIYNNEDCYRQIWKFESVLSFKNLENWFDQWIYFMEALQRRI